MHFCVNFALCVCTVASSFPGLFPLKLGGAGKALGTRLCTVEPGNSNFTRKSKTVQVSGQFELSGTISEKV